MSADHNGTGNLQIDSATQAVTRRHTQPFGEQRGQNPAAWSGEKGFVGGTQDPTGLTHLGARHYDTATGRFISVDPVADFKDPQQINGYAYSSNNPVTFADPDGKFWLSLVKIVRAVVRAVTAVVHAINRSRARPPVNRRIGISPIGTSGWLGPPLGIKPWNATVNFGYAGEPSDPQAQGGFLDFLGGIGHNIVAGAEAVTNVTPYCWIEDCSGATKKYDDFVTRKGLDSDAKAWDSGDTVAEVAGLFSSVGAIRSLAKKLLKGGSAKAGERGAKKTAKEGAGSSTRGAIIPEGNTTTSSAR
ncbi:RHS repeat-associated core domain-containing protein [Streptomyces sp. NBC_01716]|uniref:RHS repeat-associated core domain-containing protein n=1 Tax=Streptomyces sp. NBC_01716 TaxID=2975917 RepID=UPI002E345C63|nr:RHS repeat-associated core domain-containing protein [Streptomyces sp. NBC_01716]